MIDKIVLFGGNGMLGNYINRYFRQKLKVIRLTRADYDILELSEYQLIQHFKKINVNNNTLIFNAAGLIPSAKSNGISTTKEDFIKINGKFPIMLANVAKLFDAKMIHPTTDCVYDGLSPEGMYTENDTATETNDYGISKAYGDQADCTIIRTSIIGEELRNKRSLVEWIKKQSNTIIKGYTNHLWNGITCLQYAKIIEEMINDNIFWKGVRHLYSPKVYSKYEIVQMVNQIYGLDITVISHKTEEDCNKTLSSLYEPAFMIPDLYDQIVELKEFCLEE